MTEVFSEPDDEGTGDEGKYVYCVIKSPDDREFGPVGIGDGTNRVYTVHYEELAAVVSDTRIRVYDPTRENVLDHELVNETVMREFRVIDHLASKIEPREQKQSDHTNQRGELTYGR